MLRRQVLASCLYGSVLSVSFFILRCGYYFFFRTLVREAWSSRPQQARMGSGEYEHGMSSLRQPTGPRRCSPIVQSSEQRKTGTTSRQD